MMQVAVEPNMNKSINLVFSPLFKASLRKYPKPIALIVSSIKSNIIKIHYNILLVLIP